jgi:IS30 family transposase
MTTRHAPRAGLVQVVDDVDDRDELRAEAFDPHRLSDLERSEIVELSQAIRSMTRLGALLGVCPDTIDRIVCRRRRARPATIAKVRRALAARRAFIHVHEGLQ